MGKFEAKRTGLVKNGGINGGGEIRRLARKKKATPKRKVKELSNKDLKYLSENL